MSGTMVRQGGRVQLEHSDMCLALNMAKMAKGRFSRAAIEEWEQLIQKPRAEVREEKKRGVELPGHQKVKAAMERHPAMVYKNHSASCSPCQNGTAKNPVTRWRRKRTSPPPAEPEAPPPGTPPAPPGDAEGNQSYEIEGMPSRCVYMHSPHPNTQFFNLNAFAKESKRDKDFIPDLLSTLSAAWKYRWHWFCRRQQPFGRICGLARELIESNWWDKSLYILNDIFICTIIEQCSDNGNIHETDRTTVKTLYLIIYAKVTGCIMRIRLWQNECQGSVNNFWPCGMVNQRAR